MQIKNYIVDNIDIITDCLEKELCQNGISYIRIDNEIHFGNKIIRFYDLKIHKNIIIFLAFNNISVDYFPSILDNLDVLNNETPQLCPIDEMQYYKKETNYQQPKKKNYKQESKRVNRLLKKYKR